MNSLLTLPEVAQALRVSEKTILRHLRAGVLPGVKVGHAWRVDAGRLMDWLNDGGSGRTG